MIFVSVVPSLQFHDRIWGFKTTCQCDVNNQKFLLYYIKYQLNLCSSPYLNSLFDRMCFWYIWSNVSKCWIENLVSLQCHWSFQWSITEFNTHHSYVFSDVYTNFLCTSAQFIIITLSQYFHQTFQWYTEPPIQTLIAEFYHTPVHKLWAFLTHNHSF